MKLRWIANLRRGNIIQGRLRDALRRGEGHRMAEALQLQAATRPGNTLRFARLALQPPERLMRRLHQVLLREAPRHSASRVRVRAAPPPALAWAREVIPVAARRRRYGTAFRSVVPTFGDADIHRRIMLSIGQATTPNELLELFETESAALDEHEYGWYTAKATVDRIFRMGNTASFTLCLSCSLSFSPSLSLPLCLLVSLFALSLRLCLPSACLN